MGTILIFPTPYLPNLLFTGPGRGLASCLAIDCLYSLDGGWPGFALRNFSQLFSFILVTNFDFEFSSLLIGVLFLNLVPC